MIADTEPHFTFNAEPLSRGVILPPPAEEDFPTECFKNSPFQYVCKHTTDYVRRVLEAAPLSRTRSYIAVDIKVHQVVTGHYTCIPGWHCDTVIDPRQDSLGEIHHLFVTGNAALTEFIANPVRLRLTPGKIGTELLQDLRVQIEQANCQVARVPSCQFVTYGRFDMHRAALGAFSETRLLIRLTETNVIRPTIKRIDCKNY